MQSVMFAQKYILSNMNVLILYYGEITATLSQLHWHLPDTYSNVLHSSIQSLPVVGQITSTIMQHMTQV